MADKYAQLVELLDEQGVLQSDHYWAEPIIAFVKKSKPKRNSRAQLPSQGGEAVEVVAWRHWGDKTRLLCDLGKQRAVPGTIADEFTVPLMTVAQHQRIMAAASAKQGKAVAWRVTGRDGLTVTAQYPEWAEADCLLTITPLYTHPADQVAFEALQHAVAYLSRSPMEAIHSGSALHKLMVQALAKP